MPTQVGQKAPDFQGQALMPNGEFKEIKLADYKGKWGGVVFLPRSISAFVCAHRNQSLQREVWEEFKKMGAEVITASTDSVYSH